MSDPTPTNRGVAPADQTSTQSVVIVTGPTASGKSALGVELALAVGGEVVNADSVQFFKGFDIGSAKITAAEQRGVPHHLLSVLDPLEKITAGRFVGLADRAIADIASRGMLPILVGGTGLYIRALLAGLANAEEASDEIREVIESEMSRLTSLEPTTERSVLMHGWLTRIDPTTAAQLSPRDISRIQRALEVFLTSGVSLSELQTAHGNREHRYRALIVIWNPFERDELYRRIDVRVEQMVEGGLDAEVRSLLSTVPEGSPALGAIGYREMVRHLGGELSKPEAISLIQQNTRRFAKRQLTWWRNQPGKLNWRVVPESGDRGSLASVQAFIECRQPFDDNKVFVIEAGGVQLHSGL